MVTARRNHGSCALGKYLYVFFGDHFGDRILSVERLAVEERGAEWETIQDFQGDEYPVGCLKPSVTTLNQTDIVIMGGDFLKASEVFIFDTKKTSFKKVASLPAKTKAAPFVNTG